MSYAVNQITDVTRSILASIAATAISSLCALAQTPVDQDMDRERVVIAGPEYAASSLRRKLLGDNYRNLWTTPIRVRVLDLHTFAGGLTPLRVGGGLQTRSLRLVGADSSQYVFREINKSKTALPDVFDGSMVWRIYMDMRSASHPAATLAVVPLMKSAGLLHPVPQLVIMPDDPRLGAFRREFAGMLGTIEPYTTPPRRGRAFANAIEMLDAEQLLDSINASPLNRVDAYAFLKARLVDMLVGDNDRHADQWRWAKFTPSGLFEPIARDHDKAFVSYEGSVMRIARRFFSFLVTFSPVYPDPMDLFHETAMFDKRLLAPLDESAWIKAAGEVQRAVTDSVIAEVIAAMPREYRPLSRDLQANLRARRDKLPEVARLYFREIWHLAEIHGTDANEHAIITRLPNGFVDVTMLHAGAPWYQRQFDPSVTSELRVYLHDGNDTASIFGSSNRSISVRVIGGNGINHLVDQSVVGGERNTARLYDNGRVEDVRYGRDTVQENADPSNALNHLYDRRPWVWSHGGYVPPAKDFGTSTVPFVGLRSSHGLGLIPKVGIVRRSLGFRKLPYASVMSSDISMSTRSRGFKLITDYDKRFESSDFHFKNTAYVSQLEMVEFRGFGNDAALPQGSAFDVKQRQWYINPAIGFTFAPESDITFGALLSYTKTDSVVNQFVTQLHPYGFSKFAQAGLRLAAHYESRVRPDTSRLRSVLDFNANAFPGIMDATSAYQTIEGSAKMFVTIPAATLPVIALRAGGKKVFGDFPYFDASFIGGASSFRTEHRHRYAGDAALYGSAELRVPVAKFPLILPLDVGVLGFTDAARIYAGGHLPDGWHNAHGAGFWVGAINAANNVNVLFTNEANRRVMVTLGFTY